MAPLDGLRVIDLTRVVAGPFCTMMLGDMGADVLKIEEPAHGDDSRAWAPFIAGTGSFYLALNRSKKSVALDLRSPEGANALRQLVEGRHDLNSYAERVCNILAELVTRKAA